MRYFILLCMADKAKGARSWLCMSLGRAWHRLPDGASRGVNQGISAVRPDADAWRGTDFDR